MRGSQVYQTDGQTCERTDILIASAALLYVLRPKTGRTEGGARAVVHSQYKRVSIRYKKTQMFKKVRNGT